MKLKIKVTKEILMESMYCGTAKSGNPANIGDNCAVALACKEIFPECFVTSSFIDVWKFKYNSPLIDLPNAAKLFIYKFDRLQFTPEKRLDLPELEFEVEIPQTVIDTINIEELKKSLKESKTLELV